MAEVEFGDSELFEQLEEETAPQASHIRFQEAEDWDAEPGGLKDNLAKCEETIAQLRLENQELRRKLSILSRPSGLSVDEKFEGPLLQILFMNHVVSKQYHQEIEDFVSNLSQKYEEQRKANTEKTDFNIKPQPSSILLEESENSTAENFKKIKEAFSVVGSVLYFTNFCLDKLGQPLLNENPQLTDGWEVPKYQQVFTQIVSLDGQEVQVKAKRPKPCCFNCGSEEHQLKDCPKPRDFVHIGMKRKQFMDSCGDSGNQNYQQRYHAEEVAERFAKFKPGVISEELQEALGITPYHLPQFIYRMRQIGYPPGWLKDAELENSGLSLYDGRGDNSDGEIKEDSLANKHVSYDLSRLVSYPGFNIATAPGVSDDWRSFGSMPMQPSHQKESFANYLNCSFPKPNHNSSQRTSQSQSEKKRQKTSENSKAGSSVDMDIGSDSDASFCTQGFKFQPPLPPGSPCNTPPLLHRTPPSTPPNFIPPPPPTPTPPPLPKGTPPPTPTRGSPLLQSRSGIHTDSPVTVSMDEDTLTLEELEEQQRLIWAALENAESTNSDSDVPAPLNGNSVNSSERTDIDISTGNEMASLEKEIVFTEPVSQGLDENVPLVPEEETMKEEDIDDLNVLQKAVAESNGSAVIHNDISEVNEDTTEEATFVEPTVSKSSIPDRSKFAEGITPFEYENMSESTGVYLRLRSVLKNSPRNQQKIKKAI